MASFLDGASERVAVTEQAVKAGAAETDVAAINEDWERLPRTAKPAMLNHFLVNSRKSVDIAKRLFRHKALNPLDRIIAPAERAELVSLMTPLVEEHNRAFDLYMSAAICEIDSLITAGHKKPLEFNDEPSTIAYLRKRPPRPGIDILERDLYVGGSKIDVFRSVGGALYGLANAEAPSLSSMVDYLLFVRTDLATKVGQWFVQVGALNSAELAVLLERIHAGK